MNENIIKTKLYTFDEMKEAVMQAISDVAMCSISNSDFDDPARVALMEMALGAKIVKNLDEKREKGEL